MNKIWLGVIIYLIVMNIVGFASMGIDKQKAIKHEWRTKEATLFLFAILGGFIGSILGMKVFRHKTKHMKFVIGMPVVLIMWLAAVGIYMYQFIF